MAFHREAVERTVDRVGEDVLEHVGPQRRVGQKEGGQSPHSRADHGSTFGHSQGRSQSTLAVNAPARAWGPSAATTARSIAPDSLIPAFTPLARKPRGMKRSVPPFISDKLLSQNPAVSRWSHPGHTRARCGS